MSCAQSRWISRGRNWDLAQWADGSERLEPEKVKGQPLCMASYKYLWVSASVERNMC